VKVKTATFDSIPYPKQMNRCESIHTVSTGVSRKFSGCDKQRHRKLHVDNVEVWNRGGIFLSPIVIGCQDHCELLQKAPMSGVCIVYLGNNIHYTYIGVNSISQCDCVCSTNHKCHGSL